MSYCIYLRKSRKDNEAEQRGEGETLARHEKALTEFAKNNHLEVSAIYREVVSGESIAARPQMQRLLSEVGEKMFDGVIVMDIDRLARGNTIDQGIIAQTFLFSDTKLITPTKTYDPSNEFDEEYFEFGLYMSRREYKTINRRLQRGRVASCKEGKYVCSKAPYGYQRVKIDGEKGYTLAPIPEQAEIVRNIFEWYTEGKVMFSGGAKERIGVSLIARELNKISVKPLKSDVWTSSSIRDILINPVYIGKIRWNWRPEKKKMSDGRVIKERPRSNDFLLYDGLHEGIISEDVFEKAQSIMQKNKSRPVRADKVPQNPLASLVVCKKCGRKMQRRPNPTTPDLLICAEPTCNNHASYMHLVEKSVIEYIRKWSVGDIFPNDEEAVDGTACQAELEVISKNEAKVNAQLQKAYEAFDTCIYDADTVKQRSQTLKTQLSELKTKKAVCLDKITAVERRNNIYQVFIPRVQRVLAVYDTLSSAKEKNDMLKSIVERIDYAKDTHGHGHETEFVVTVYPKFLP